MATLEKTEYMAGCCSGRVYGAYLEEGTHERAVQEALSSGPLSTGQR